MFRFFLNAIYYTFPLLYAAKVRISLFSQYHTLFLFRDPWDLLGKDPGEVLEKEVNKESEAKVEPGKLTEQIARIYLLRLCLLKEN